MSARQTESMKSPYGKTVLVTGASSGIGLHIVRQLLARGYTVYGASRSMPEVLPGLVANEPSLAPLIAARLDVLDEQACIDLVRRIVEEQGELSAVFHCAGFGIAGSVEETDMETVRRQMDQLIYGTVHTVRPALPVMRLQGRGLLVLISSVAASVPVPFQTYYSAAKAAVSAFGIALADEVDPHGIRVVVVAPGDTRTGFTNAREVIVDQTDDARSPYGDRIRRSVERMARDEQNGLDPSVVAWAAVRNMVRKYPPLHQTPGLFYKVVMIALRILPTRLFRKIIRLLYA